MEDGNNYKVWNWDEDDELSFICDHKSLFSAGWATPFSLSPPRHHHSPPHTHLTTTTTTTTTLEEREREMDGCFWSSKHHVAKIVLEE